MTAKGTLGASYSLMQISDGWDESCAFMWPASRLRDLRSPGTRSEPRGRGGRAAQSPLPEPPGWERPQASKGFLCPQPGRRSPSGRPSRPRPLVCVTPALRSGLARGNVTGSTAVCVLASHNLGQQLCPREPVPGASTSLVTKPLPKTLRSEQRPLGRTRTNFICDVLGPAEFPALGRETRRIPGRRASGRKTARSDASFVSVNPRVD